MKFKSIFIFFFVIGLCLLTLSYFFLTGKYSSFPSKLSSVISDVNLIDRKINTNSLPLTLSYKYNLKKFGAVGDGGSFVVFPQAIIYMDSYGNFFKLSHQSKVEKLEIKAPNNIESLIKDLKKNADDKSYQAPSGGTLRATSIIFDIDRIYIAYNYYVSKNKIRLCVSSIAFNSTSLVFPKGNVWTQVYKGPVINIDNSLGSGGKLALLNNDLYLSIGFPPDIDFKNDKKNNLNENLSPQRVNLARGKVLKIDKTTFKYSIFTLGHRVPEGLSLLNNNILIESEHGPQGGDEINLLVEHSNYGYPLFSYGSKYGSYSWNDNLNLYRKPLFAFVPSIGLSQTIQLKSFNPRFYGDLLAGSLKAQSIFRLKFEDGRIIYSEPIFIGHRVRDIIEFNHSIFILTDDPYIIELSVDSKALKFDNNNNKGLYFWSKPLQAKCLNCHTFTQSNPTSAAPSLSNLIGRKVATDNFIYYSEAIKKNNFVWTKDNLKIFLQNPQKMIPGTTMPSLRLNSQEIDEIANVIESNK